MYERPTLESDATILEEYYGQKNEQIKGRALHQYLCLL